MDLTGIGAIFDFSGKVIDKIFPDQSQRDAAKLELIKLQESGELAKLASTTQLALGQLEVNKVEAASSSVFVSGGRPFVMWVCGFALAYASIIEPIARFCASVFMGYTGAFPVIDTMLTLQILGGLLGLGAMRMNEKINGVASK